MNRMFSNHYMHSRTTFSFYQTILAIGYHLMDMNKDAIKLLFTVRDFHSLVSDMGGRGVKNPDFRSDVLFAWPQYPHQ